MKSFFFCAVKGQKKTKHTKRGFGGCKTNLFLGVPSGKSGSTNYPRAFPLCVFTLTASSSDLPGT